MTTKKDIMDYILNTPTNTNPAILSGMLDSISSGGVEIITFFDDDILFTYTEGTDQFDYAKGIYESIGFQFPKGVAKISLEDIVVIQLMPGDFNYLTYGDYFSQGSYQIDNAEDGTTFRFRVCDENHLTNPELEAYCQSPHHLKVELFKI